MNNGKHILECLLSVPKPTKHTQLRESIKTLRRNT